MGSDDFITSIIDSILEILIGLLRAQFSAIFDLIDAIQAFTM